VLRGAVSPVLAVDSTLTCAWACFELGILVTALLVMHPMLVTALLALRSHVEGHGFWW
jgi:hypothetical protein